MMSMTPRQQMAYSRLCFTADATKAPRFGWVVTHGRQVFTVRLTANVGLE